MVNRFFAIFGVGGMVVLPVWWVLVFVDDMSHPERWDRDWTHDPRLYVPFGLVAVGVPVALLIRELVRPPLKVRLQRLLNQAGQLRAAGQHTEADKVLADFRRLWERNRLQGRYPLR
jgi:hypothetical protein